MPYDALSLPLSLSVCMCVFMHCCVSPDPAELPFNIVQKLLRLIPGVNAILPDLKDSDPRKAYQDTWYGTDISASLPKAMRSRTSPVTPSPPSDEDAEREREGAAGAGAEDAIAKESVEMVSNDEIS